MTERRPPNEIRTAEPDASDKRYQAYLDHRQQLVSAERELGGSFDKYLLTLSGGALGLSLTFLGQIVGHDCVVGGCLFGAGWVALSLTVVAMLACIRISLDGCEKSRDVLDDEFARPDCSVFARVRDRQGNLYHARCVRILNWIGLSFFVIGAVCLLWFTLQSISYSGRSQSVNDSSKPNQLMAEHSVPQSPVTSQPDRFSDPTPVIERQSFVPPSAPVDQTPPAPPPPPTESKPDE